MNEEIENLQADNRWLSEKYNEDVKRLRKEITYLNYQLRIFIDENEAYKAKPKVCGECKYGGQSKEYYLEGKDTDYVRCYNHKVRDRDREVSHVSTACILGEKKEMKNED